MPGTRISSEQVAYWFFRLNGCLCLTNFLVHHEDRQDGTDVDVLAARFPFRKELAYSEEPMADHAVFDSSGKIDLILAEAKQGRCQLNGPWTDSDKRNMHRVLHAVGAFPLEDADRVADALYREKQYEDDQYRVRLFAIGRQKNTDSSYENVAQLTWQEVLEFIFDRFNEYRGYKNQHRQWDRSGQRLFTQAIRFRHNRTGFSDAILSDWEST